MSNKIVNIDVKSNNAKYSVNESALLNRINNLLSIAQNTIPFNRELGTTLEFYLFRPYNFITFNLIEIEIKNVIKRYFPETEVTVNKKELDPSTRRYELEIVITHPLLETTLILNKSYLSYE